MFLPLWFEDTCHELPPVVTMNMDEIGTNMGHPDPPFGTRLTEEHGLFLGPTGDEVRQRALQRLRLSELALARRRPVARPN